MGKQRQQTQTGVTASVASKMTPPTREQIAKRAREIFLARDGAPGIDLDDWLQAERELKADAAGRSTDDSGVKKEGRQEP
jgi:hypothetical protein